MILFLLLIVSIIGFIKLNYQKFKSGAIKVKGYPIIGNLIDLLPDNFLNSISYFTKKFGPVVEFFVFSQRFLLISDTKVIKEILMRRPKQFQRSSKSDYPAKLMGFLPSALFSAHDPKIWSRIRRLTSPAFSKINVSNMIISIHSECEKFIKVINKSIEQNEGKKVVLDIMNMFQVFTVRVISSVTFGAELETGSLAGQYFFTQQFIQDVHDILDFTIEIILFPMPKFFWNLIPSKVVIEREAIKGNNRINVNCQLLADEKRKSLEANKNSPSGSSALLDIILRQGGDDDGESRKSITVDEIVANVKIFYLAGSETSSIVLSWSIYFLSLHPDVLASVREEVDPLFHSLNISEGDPLRLEKLKEFEAKLDFCRSVMKESMRLRTPASTLFFSVHESYKETCIIPWEKELSNQGEKKKELPISPTDEIIISLQGALLDEAIFPDPTAFLPSRWLDSSSGEKDAILLAFGFGPRVCPGMGLAISECAVLIAFIAHYFDFTLACPASEIHSVFSFTTKPNKMPMTFSTRK
jgi:cytochrome P450